MERKPPGERGKRSGPGVGPLKPPPFEPDPCLVAYLEGGSKQDAVRRFEAEIEDQERRRAT